MLTQISVLLSCLLVLPGVDVNYSKDFREVNSKVTASQNTGEWQNLFLKKKKKRKKRQCRDGLDNDGDGFIDFPADPGCRSRKDRKEINLNNSAPLDTQLGNRRPFPDDNPWNKDISGEPVDANSDALIASIGLDTGLHPDFGTVYEGSPIGIPYIVVSGTQPLVPITNILYGDESDPGPYPIPGNAPIEGGVDSDGDRHVLVIDRGNFILYELYRAFKTTNGWRADSAAIFDLNSNDLRPEGWTSADAAGLPVFPGLVRYEEVFDLGEIRHALRFTCRRTRRAYVPPARHYASSNTSPDLPPMGMRVRLKASVDISSYPAPVQVILQAMKTYGMFVADNGSDWYVSGAPDSRWDDDMLRSLRSIKGRDFEVVQMDGLVVGD